jgi:hypothetical protein
MMWVWVTLVYLVPAVVVTIQILSPEGHPSKIFPKTGYAEATRAARPRDQF